MERTGLYEPELAVARCSSALDTAFSVGVETIIDCTPIDLGRQASLLDRLRHRSPVRIIAATGVYRWIPLTFYTWSAETIAEHFLREIQEGIEDTDIRAGVVKIAWDVEFSLSEGASSPRAQLEKCARGAARAARLAGVPIICHTRAADRNGHALLDLLEEEGVSLRAVTIGHLNDSDDLDYVLSLARRGATIGLDRLLPRYDESELERRMALALNVIRAGFARQMTFGHDNAAYSVNMGPPEGGPRQEDSRCWTKVSEAELPWLRQRGAADEDIADVMIHSVREMFDAAAATTGSSPVRCP